MIKFDKRIMHSSFKKKIETDAFMCNKEIFCLEFKTKKQTHSRIQ